MARKRKKPQPLVVARGSARAWPRAALWFLANDDAVLWQAHPGEEPDVIRVVGESFPELGYDCAFSFDGQDTLYNMRLWCGAQPAIVDRSTIDEAARRWLTADDTCELRLVTPANGRIQASGVWISDPLDLVLFGFADADFATLLGDDVDVVHVAPDVSVAVDRAGGTPRWILARDIARRLDYGKEFTRDQHGAELMQALAKLYVACARDHDAVETKSAFRVRVAHLVNAALGEGRKQQLDLAPTLESFVSHYEFKRPEYIIPPKRPPPR